MSTPQIRLVDTTSTPAPYPEGVKARGWRFDLDPERIEASDTWALAPAEIRPWLLMLWFKAWQSIPCGSLPPDDALVAARIGMPLLQFQTHRAVLMRGWWRAADGRLYHPVITEHVLDMVRRRKSDVDRKKFHRNPVGVQSESTVIPAPTPTPTLTDKVNPSRPRPSAEDLVPYQKVVDLYHQKLPMLSRVYALTEARKAAIRARWKDGSCPDLEAWGAFFEVVAKSNFLTGQARPNGDRKPFRADLEWLTRESNFVKVLEGRYHHA